MRLMHKYRLAVKSCATLHIVLWGHIHRSNLAREWWKLDCHANQNVLPNQNQSILVHVYCLFGLCGTLHCQVLYQGD